ncbi:MAG: hypothetical protein JWQ94_76 [Tardiphaga sp.]|jgi:hypothetical protein|nr:hypothetical protein [Tardiphaga sp.]
MQMRIWLAAMGLAVAVGAPPLTTTAQAQDAPRVTRIERGPEVSAPHRRPRARVRIYRNDADDGVYPRYNPGPNAVRDCTATLVQEFRPSGTVIVPHMNCFWRRG